MGENFDLVLRGLVGVFTYQNLHAALAGALAGPLVKFNNRRDNNRDRLVCDLLDLVFHV
jgi:hypothetical protein